MNNENDMVTPASTTNEEAIVVSVSQEFDQWLVDLGEKYKMHPLNVASIGLARLLVLCKATNCLDKFENIMEGISEEIRTLGDFYDKPTVDTGDTNENTESES